MLLNAESWHFPNTEHMFERIGAKRAKFFAVMDFTQGFHQAEGRSLFRYLTVFITFCGIFNASDYGVGGYLYQLIDDRERPVAFVSKSFTGPQLIRYQ